MSSSSGEDYGSMQGSFVDDLDSDFGECVAEYDVDENGNPLNPKGTITKGESVREKPQEKTEEDPEARKKRKRLEKLDKKI